jgi:protoporphyrinogen/coproporphyrinogen III oxidase
MKRIAIVGGGISGLSAAFALQQQLEHQAEQEKTRGATLEYVLFESSARLGGVIHTENIDGCVVEAGPDSFLTEKPWAAELCRELGLGDQLIGSNDAERKTYILLKGRLVPLPDGLQFMVPTRLAAAFFSPLFSWGTKARIIREWFYRPGGADSECTVTEFVERHYGHEMVERVADPLLAGVYGGSADELSVTSVLPRFLEMEAKHGSLGRAMVAAKRNQFAVAELRSAGQMRASVPTPSLFTSLRDGMQQVVDALLTRIPDAARRLNARIEAVRPESGKWLAVSGGRTEEFDAAILATPAYAAAELLGSASAEFAGKLNAIRYSSSVTAILSYDQKVRAALPPGFGFLVPRAENRRVLAATFVHNKFPHRAPDDRALIRCFLGGTRDEEILQRSDDEILALVRRELQLILGITAEPLLVRIHKWKQAMAQYGIGHTTRVERIKGLVEGMPGLTLAGNAYGGIGVPDCVRSGLEAAAKTLVDIGIVQPRRQAVR